MRSIVLKKTKTPSKKKSPSSKKKTIWYFEWAFRSFDLSYFCVRQKAVFNRETIPKQLPI